MTKFTFTYLLLLWLPTSTAWAEDADLHITLSLEEATTLMRQQSYDLQLAQTRIEQAALLESQALSIWIPSVNLIARYALRDEEVTLQFPNTFALLGPYLDAVAADHPEVPASLAAANIPDARELAKIPSQPSTIQPRHSYMLIASVHQTLFNARAFPLMRLADLSVLQAQNAQEQAEFALQGALHQLYFNALTFKRLVAVSARNVALHELIYQRRLIALEEGVGNRFETNRANVNLSKARRDLDQARVAHNLSINALATFLVTDPNFDVTMPPTLPVPNSLDGFLENALEERADLQSLDISVAMARESLAENNATFWPVLGAEFQGVFQRAAQFSGNPFYWSLTIQAQWTLWDGGMRNTESRSREIAIAQAEIQRRSQRHQLSNQLQQAWLRIKNQQSSIASAHAEVALAQENYDITRDALELGAATALDVELAQQQLYLSELALATAEIDLQAQLYELARISATQTTSR